MLLRLRLRLRLRLLLRLFGRLLFFGLLLLLLLLRLLFLLFIGLRLRLHGRYGDRSDLNRYFLLRLFRIIDLRVYRWSRCVIPLLFGLLLLGLLLRVLPGRGLLLSWLLLDG